MHEKKGRTITVVTYDLEIMKHTKRVVYIRDGEIGKVGNLKEKVPEE